MESRIIAEFDAILSKVIANTNRRDEPIAKDKNEIILGDFSIRRDRGLFCVVERKSHKVRFQNLMLINSAFIITKALKLNQTHRIDKILSYEKEYSKHKTDMVFYAHAFKSALASKEFRKTEIIQYRYELSRDITMRLKAKIRDMDKNIRK